MNQRSPTLAACATRRMLAWRRSLPLAGCATGPHANPRDPFEPFNRKVSRSTTSVDAVVLKPGRHGLPRDSAAAGAHRRDQLLRQPGRRLVGVNSVLQVKLQATPPRTSCAFNVNTVFGLGGMLDIASEIGHRAPQRGLRPDAGPLGRAARAPTWCCRCSGPSTVRDTVALPVDCAGRSADPSSTPAATRNCAVRRCAWSTCAPTCCAPARCWTTPRWTVQLHCATPTCSAAAAEIYDGDRHGRRRRRPGPERKARPPAARRRSAAPCRGTGRPAPSR